MGKTTTKKVIKTQVSPDPAKLAQLETIEKDIKSGLIKYYETAFLLQRIVDEKMYLLRGYSTFRKYCEETFNFGRSYGYRLVAYARVLKSLKLNATSDIPERLIRPLASLSAEQQKQAWDQAKKLSKNNELPELKAVAKTVKDFRVKDKEQKLIEQFGECDNDSFICRTLGFKANFSTVTDELISRANSNPKKLCMAYKEMSAKIEFADKAKKQIKDAILEAYATQLDKMLEGQEEESVKDE